MEELLTYVDRRGSGCTKWDHQTEMFGTEGLLPLWIADMDFRVARCVQDAVRAYADFGVYGYAPAPESYYQAFMDWERERHGYAVDRQWLRFSPGVVPAFNWLIQCLTQPEDRVLLLTPVYHPFHHAVANNGRTLVTSQLREDQGRYTIDIADFEQKIVNNQVKLFILCSPHNPVGRVWTQEELHQMLDICRRHGVYVIADEIHHDLIMPGHTHIPAATVGNYDDMLVTLTAPSKTFNLAGLQNALVIIPDQAIRAKYDDFATCVRIFTGNAVGYVAAEAAWRGGISWLEQVKATVLDNFQFVRDTLTSALPKLVVTPLEGTYLMWIDFSAYLSEEEIAPFFQEKCRIGVDYGSLFGGGHSCCVRLNLATAHEVMAEAVKRILAHQDALLAKASQI